VRHIIARCSRFIWRAFQAFTTLIFGLFALVLIAIAIGVGLEQRGPEIPEGGALVLNPSGVLVDQKNAVDPATMVLQGGDTQQQTLVKDVIDALDLAKNDDRIGLVVLDLDKLGHGLIPKLLRIASAIDNFKTSGKKVIAVANNYSQSALLLAAHADEVLLNPEGIALPEGYSMHRTYYKSLLENTDVSVNIYKVGKYKSAMEPYFRDSMSEEDREARLAILDTWWSAYTSRIETQRGIDEGRIDNILQDAPNQIRLAQGNLARLSLDNGLVDRLLTSNEQRDYLMEVAGENADTDEYKRIGFNHYLTVARLPTANKDNKVAVITAVGPIVDGKAPAGEIGSQSLSRLIRKARLNDDVKAIVLRVDSGGGSKTASEIIRQELLTAQESGIPVVASFGSVAASGGYWISATADEIWASPTTVTGSIGIFGMLLSFENTRRRQYRTRCLAGVRRIHTTGSGGWLSAIFNNSSTGA